MEDNVLEIRQEGGLTLDGLPFLQEENGGGEAPAVVPEETPVAPQQVETGLSFLNGNVGGAPQETATNQAPQDPNELTVLIDQVQDQANSGAVAPPSEENPDHSALGGALKWNTENNAWEVNMEFFGLPHPKDLHHSIKPTVDTGIGVVNGAIDAFQSIYDLTADGMNVPFQILEKMLDKKQPIHRFGGLEIPRLPEAQTIVGNIANGMTQFLLPFSKVKPLVNLGKGATVNNLAAGAVADFIAYDEHEERLSNLIQDYPALRNPVTEYLQAGPEDSWAEGRFKQTIEGMLLGAGQDTVGPMVRWMRGFKKAKLLKDAGKVKEADKVIKEMSEELTDNAARKLSKPGEPSLEDATKKPVGRPKKEAITEEQFDQMAKTILEDPIGPSPLPHINEHFNVMKWRKKKDALDATDALVSHLEKNNPEVFGDKRTFEQVKRMAKNLLKDPDALLKDIDLLEKSTKKLDSQMLAGLITMNNIADQLPVIAKQYSNLVQVGNLDEAAKAKDALKMAVEIYSDHMTKFKSLKKNVARGLGAGRLGADSIKTKKVHPEEVGALLNELEIDGDFENFAKKLQHIGSGKGIAKALSHVFKTGVWDIPNEIYINSILSGVTTHVTNTFFTGLETLIRPSEKALAASLRKDWMGVRAEFAAYKGMLRGASESFHMGVKAFLNDNNVLDPLHAINEVQANHAISVGDGKITGNGFAGGLVNVVGKGVRMPSRFLLAEDEVFKQINYRSRRYADGIERGLKKGLRNNDLEEFALKYIDEGFDEAGAAVDPDALRFAEESTFTNDLVYGIGKDFQNMVTKYPALRQLLPFVRTPTNLVRNTLHRLPLTAPLYKQVRKELSGELGARAQSEAIAKIMVGSSFTLLAMNLASNGVITGDLPKARNLRQQAVDAGQLAYTFNLPNGEHFSFERADPRFAIFGLVADANNIMGELDDNTAAEVMMSLTLAFAANMTNKTYLKGLKDTLEAINADPNDPERAAGFLRRQLVPRAVPYSSFLKQINSDQEVKEIRSYMDGIMANVPGYSEQIEAKRNVLGETVYRPEGFLLGVFSPIKMSKDTDEVLKLEMHRLNREFPPPAEKKFSGRVNLADFKNSKGQSAYDRWGELTGTIEASGKTLKDKLTDLVHSQKYQETLSDVGVEDGLRSGKAEMISQVISAYRDRAWRMVLKEYPDLKDVVENETKLKKMSLYQRKQEKVLELLQQQSN